MHKHCITLLISKCKTLNSCHTVMQEGHNAMLQKQYIYLRCKTPRLPHILPMLLAAYTVPEYGMALTPEA